MVEFLNTYFELLQFTEIIYITNKGYQYVVCLSLIPYVRLFMRNIQTQMYLRTHWKLDTCLYELTYSE
jgi:hypothetical protein